jgi:putative transposase
MTKAHMLEIAEVDIAYDVQGPLPTAADVHYGLAAAKATERAATLTIARAANPERFTSSTPPKILHLPDSAWINPPLPVQPAA